MFRFEHLEYLYGLALVPLLLLLFLVALFRRKQLRARIGNPQVVSRLLSGYSKYKHSFKFLFIALAVCFGIIAFANPQMGSKKEKVQRKGVDIFIALDVSRSMLAEDARPSRMEKAKQFCLKLINKLKGDRIGTIIFAGNAYLQMPLTVDYSAAQLFAKSASPNMVPTQGTAIADAINLALKSHNEDNKSHKALILITDGENHEKEALKAAQKAREKGLIIYTVGVGSEAGAPIPVIDNGRRAYLKDKSGSTVQSRMNSGMLKELASAAGGKYFNIKSGNSIFASLTAKINSMEKQEFEQRSFASYETYFQYFLGICILLLVLEFFISYRKSALLSGKDLFSAS